MVRLTVAVVLALLVGCGGDPENTGDDDPAIDAATDDVDGAPACGAQWMLEDRPVTALALLDPVMINGGRSVRIGVSVELGPCDEIAMMSVGYAFEAPSAILQVRVWRPVDERSESHGVGALPALPVGRGRSPLGIDECQLDGPVRTVIRPLTLRLEWVATWTITAQNFPDEAVSLSFPVTAPPARACDPGRATCEMDCDCANAGERCLGYSGLAGPAVSCEVPCEADRDCGGTSCQGDVDDGIGHVCTGGDECGAGDPCPTGWTCASGACTPDFTLNQASRHECACDADCDPGLRCVQPYDPNGAPRCQAICETAGDWCQGPHFCTSVGGDVSGLAGTDSVCGWVGD